MKSVHHIFSLHDRSYMYNISSIGKSGWPEPLSKY